MPLNPSRHAGPLTLAVVGRQAAGAAADSSDRRRNYAIVRDGALIGGVGISGIVRWPLESANVGVHVDSALRGQGIGTAALGLACELAFGDLALHRLEAGAQPTNHASLTMIRRNGFTEIGLAPGSLFVDGAWRDHMLFQKLAP
ncbi:MAG: GNAT family N-acetyltransferase [Solirubrobacteraceae bacterium]